MRLKIEEGWCSWMAPFVSGLLTAVECQRTTKAMRLPWPLEAVEVAVLVLLLLATSVSPLNFDCQDCFFGSDCSRAYNGDVGQTCGSFTDSFGNFDFCCCAPDASCGFSASECSCIGPETPTPESTLESTSTPTTTSSTPSASSSSSSGLLPGVSVAIGLGVALGVVAIVHRWYLKRRTQSPQPVAASPSSAVVSNNISSMPASCEPMMLSRGFGGARVPVLQGGVMTFVDPFQVPSNKVVPTI